jgi:hypothetical protein
MRAYLVCAYDFVLRFEVSDKSSNSSKVAVMCFSFSLDFVLCLLLSKNCLNLSGCEQKSKLLVGTTPESKFPLLSVSRFVPKRLPVCA